MADSSRLHFFLCQTKQKLNEITVNAHPQPQAFRLDVEVEAEIQQGNSNIRSPNAVRHQCHHHHSSSIRFHFPHLVANAELQLYINKTTQTTSNNHTSGTSHSIEQPRSLVAPKTIPPQTNCMLANRRQLITCHSFAFHLCWRYEFEGSVVVYPPPSGNVDRPWQTRNTVASSIYLLPRSLTNWQIEPRRRRRHHNLPNGNPDSHSNRVGKANAIDMKWWTKEKVRASNGVRESDPYGLCKSLTELSASMCRCVRIYMRLSYQFVYLIFQPKTIKQWWRQCYDRAWNSNCGHDC